MAEAKKKIQGRLRHCVDLVDQLKIDQETLCDM